MATTVGSKPHGARLLWASGAETRAPTSTWVEASCMSSRYVPESESDDRENATELLRDVGRRWMTGSSPLPGLWPPLHGFRPGEEDLGFEPTATAVTGLRRRAANDPSGGRVKASPGARDWPSFAAK